MTQVSIIFPNELKARAFMLWLEDQGEQDYFGWILIVSRDHAVSAFEYDHNHKVIIAKDTEGS